MTFDLGEIEKVIKLCSENGVREFSYGELRLVFSEGVVSAPFLESLVPEATAIAQAQEIRVRDEKIEQLDEIERLVVEDPVEYERILLSGELKNEKA